MNHDDKNPDLPAGVTPELEARLVASVLGESSAFEAAELERLARENPELAIFQRRIEAVHGLVGLAVRPEQAPLRLAPERRAKILLTIGAPSAQPPEAETDADELLILDAARHRRRKWIWASGLAASLTFAAILGMNLLPSFRDRLGHEDSEDRVGTMAKPRGKEEEVITLSQFSVSSAADKPSILAKLRQSLTEPSQSEGDARGMALADTSLSMPPPASSPAGPRAIQEAQRSRARRSDQNALLLEKNELLGVGIARDHFEVNERDLGAGKKSFAAASEQRKAGGKDKDSEAKLIAGLAFAAKSEREESASRAVSSSRLNTSLDDGFLSGANTNANASADFKAADLAATPAQVDELLSRQQAASTALPVVTAEPTRDETSAAKDPVSTFSLHVSDVSFRLAQAALARGEIPDAERIRPEEFYNAFDYGDPAPTTADKISSRIEQAAHPLIQQRNLVRIAMKVPATGRGAGQPLHLTVALDTSGSMEREDRITSVRRAFEVLASLLGPNDRVTLIGFSRDPRLLAEQLPGDQAEKLADLAANTPFAGGTNLEAALKLSGELALRHHNPVAQNRIVLLTDGAANLGNADPAQLATMIEQLRQQGIAFDACGVGADGLNDTILEALTRKGDGRYYLLNQAEDADAGFARQLAGAFRPAAQNVKVQVRFNPARVGSYRLIGFEQHRLRTEDFRNDQVDAAELAAEEAAVALYQVEVLPQGEGELGEVFVRFRDTTTDNMVERSWTMLHDAHAPAFDRSTPTMQLAGMAALLAEKLRGGDTANPVDLTELVPVVNALRGHYANDARVQELIAMFEQMRRSAAP